VRQKNLCLKKPHTSLKCLYINTWSIRNRKAVEICVQLQGHDLIAVRDMVGWLA